MHVPAPILAACVLLSCVGLSHAVSCSSTDLGPTATDGYALRTGRAVTHILNMHGCSTCAGASVLPCGLHTQAQRRLSLPMAPASAPPRWCVTTCPCCLWAWSERMCVVRVYACTLCVCVCVCVCVCMCVFGVDRPSTPPQACFTPLWLVRTWEMRTRTSLTAPPPGV